MAAATADMVTADTQDPAEAIRSLKESLCSAQTPLPIKYRALFSLKHTAKNETGANAEAAIDAIAAAIPSTSSALLKHELAYCLGQTDKKYAVTPLRRTLSDLDELVIVRHEAAEALGALGFPENLDILRQFRDRGGEDVAVTETCQLAIDRIEWKNSEESKTEKLRPSDFSSIDPAPPMPESTQTVEELGKILMDYSAPLFLRYRAMFALRDLASPPDLPTAVPAVLALAEGLKDTSSALFRHEVAFCFGQLAHPASIPALTASLANKSEVDMVRHEAAEALGNLGEEPGVEDTLKRFLQDNEDVVRESCMVALDMVDYEQSHEVEYALVPGAPKEVVL